MGKNKTTLIDAESIVPITRAPTPSGSSVIENLANFVAHDLRYITSNEARNRKRVLMPREFRED